MIKLKTGGYEIELLAAITEIPERLSSNENTIGGNNEEIYKSTHLLINVQAAIAKADYRNFLSVINTNTEQLYFTPDRILIGKQSITRLKVVLDGQPEFDNRLKNINNNIGLGYFINFNLREVLY